jgi:hypothetical protein
MRAMNCRASPTKAGTQTPGEVKSHRYRETGTGRAQTLIDFGVKNPHNPHGRRMACGMAMQQIPLAGKGRPPICGDRGPGVMNKLFVSSI